MKINETSWGGMVRRSSGERVRKEDESDFKRYLKNVEWMDMGSSKYLYAKFDYPYSEYHNGGCSLNEIIEIQKELPKNVHIMTRGNLKWLKKNHCQFREICSKIRYGCSMMNSNQPEKMYFSAEEKHWNWSNFIVAYQIDHPVEDYCVSTEINLHNSRTGDHQFFKTPRNVLTSNHKNRNEYIFTQKCLGFKLVKDKKMNESVEINETSWGGMVRRSSSEIGIRKEDEFGEDKIKLIKDNIFYTYCYRLTYMDENDIINPDVNECCDTIRDFCRNYDDLNDIIAHIKRNWKDGEKYYEYIKNEVEGQRKEVYDIGFKKKHNESIADTLNNWWNSIDDLYSKVDILLNSDVDVTEDADPNLVWDDLPWKTSIEIYMEYNKVMNGSKVNETLWAGQVRRSSGKVKREEDKLSEIDRKALDKYIEMFPKHCGIIDEGDYEFTMGEFRSFISDFSNKLGIEELNPDVKKLREYVKDNWEDGENIYEKLKELIELDECDVVAPNGGLVLGDIRGVGPITLPGECGEKGSGDLPMPTGKVYQQVAPFGTFIKMKKKKKKKKFRKEDEPCAHSDNPPVYSYVDDFRDYVDRTYNKIK